MVTVRQSRLIPQHAFWYSDLPLRASSGEGVAFLYDDVLSINAHELDLSRSGNELRGLGILFGLLSVVFPAIGAALLAYASLDLYQRGSSEWLFAALFLVALLMVAVVLAALMFRTDLATPRDPSVRFDRLSRSIKAYEVTRIWWNPFARWPTVIKEFDWNTVEAEIQKQAGFNGKAYVVRYALVLCVCKPGTYEVIDRITLKANRILTRDLEHMWNYLRRYMAEGPNGLPPVKVLPREITLRRSFFEYMRWWDPTAEGRDVRKDMPGWLFLFNSLVTLLMFPLFAGMGFGHYVAMRLAPEPDWEHAPVVRVGGDDHRSGP